MATQPGSTGEPIEPLTYKTWGLKVSIHCEGCKRKVHKVLHSVEGVYTVNIDAKQQKVVVTGNVDAATLIKKLEKSGKRAEMWPEIVEKKKKKKKSRKSKKKEKQSDPESSSDGEDQEGGGGGEGSSEKDKPTVVKVEVVQDSAKVVDSGGGSPSKATASGGGGGAASVSVKFADAAAKSAGGQAAASESKSEGKKPETVSPGSQSPAADKKAGESGGVAAGQSGGGKKKKKKGHKSPPEGEPSNVGAPAATGSALHNVGPPPVNHSPPRHAGYQYPTHYYATQPVYDVSYNTANPTSSYTASYYASQPPPSHAYMHSGPYAHYGPETESPPSDADSYPRQPLDSFELLSDENPNGCSVM